jgi:hypothetical protein
LNLRHDVVTRMLNCMKVLEEAGNKGVLQVRSLDTMKKTRATLPAKEGQPKKTGITVPNTVFGQPVAEGVGVQSHAGIAAFLQKKDEEYEAKHKFKCPLVACGQRCATASGLKIHWNARHAGLPFPASSLVMPAEFPASADLVHASCESAAPPAVVSANASTIKRAKVLHLESDYETCAMCDNSRFLKKNRNVHLASELHKQNADNAVKSGK